MELLPLRMLTEQALESGEGNLLFRKVKGGSELKEIVKLQNPEKINLHNSVS